MKKQIALALILGLLLCLCACGAKDDAPAAAVSEETPAETAASTADLEPQEAPAEASAGNVVVAPQAAGEEESGLDQEMFELAMDCIGLSPAELFATIGEPDGTEYSSSCLVDNAEDGMLYYTAYGFYVWTLRDADGSETVQDVLEM